METGDSKENSKNSKMLCLSSQYLIGCNFHDTPVCQCVKEVLLGSPYIYLLGQSKSITVIIIKILSAHLYLVNDTVAYHWHKDIMLASP